MDHERLSFLTRSYGFLQGLRIVPIGALLVGWKLIEPVWPRSNLRDSVQVALCISAIAGFVLIGRYYENRFGRVQQHGSVAWSALGLIAWLSTLALDSKNPQVSLTSLLLACFFAAGFIASHGRRWYALVPTSALFFLSVLPTAGVVSVESVDNRLLPITFGCACILTGVLDHVLLVRNLPEPSDA